MIIGLTGKNAAGKGEVANQLIKRGFVYYSLSDVIRDELTKKKLDHSRDNMIKFGNELRQKHKPNYLAEQINKKLNSNKNYVIDSVRNPSEARELRKNKDCLIIGIEAPIEMRFGRMLKRNRIGDAKTLEEFKAFEQRENLNNDAGQQLDATFAMSDKVIVNDKSLQELYSMVDKMMENLKKKRASWEQYFMNIAKQVATRSTCDRKHVGSVIVRDKTILSTGYNGSIRGMPHCDDVGHMMEDGHCVATIHAEANAILQAAKNGVRIEDSEVYITASPCWGCFKLIANAGIKKIYYGEFYRDDKIFDIAKKVGIELVHIEVDQKEL